MGGHQNNKRYIEMMRYELIREDDEELHLGQPQSGIDLTVETFHLYGTVSTPFDGSRLGLAFGLTLDMK